MGTAVTPPNTIKEFLDIVFPGNVPPQKRTEAAGLPLYDHPAPDTDEDEGLEDDEDRLYDSLSAPVSGTFSEPRTPDIRRTV